MRAGVTANLLRQRRLPKKRPTTQPRRMSTPTTTPTMTLVLLPPPLPSSPPVAEDWSPGSLVGAEEATAGSVCIDCLVGKITQWVVFLTL